MKHRVILLLISKQNVLISTGTLHCSVAFIYVRQFVMQTMENIMFQTEGN
jgi:hypothetical protein